MRRTIKDQVGHAIERILANYHFIEVVQNISRCVPRTYHMVPSHMTRRHRNPRYYAMKQDCTFNTGSNLVSSRNTASSSTSVSGETDRFLE